MKKQNKKNTKKKNSFFNYPETSNEEVLKQSKLDPNNNIYNQAILDCVKDIKKIKEFGMLIKKPIIKVLLKRLK